MEFLDYLAITAVTSTLGFFLTGIPICAKIKRRLSTEGISAMPFILCIIGCIFWLRYGLLKQDRTVISINSIGLVLELIYLAFYYIYTLHKGYLNRAILLSVGICGAMLAYIDLVSPPHDTAVAHLGMMCLTLNVMNFGAPLASVKEVMRKKTTESLPLPLIAANLACALQWFLYGYLVEDIYMTIPNMIGIGLSLLQLSLFVIYPSVRHP